MAVTSSGHRQLLERAFGHRGLPDDADSLLEQSLRPRGPSMLLDLGSDVGMCPGAIVVDAGCRDGTHARALAGRYHCRVIGVDLVDVGLGGEDVTFVQGDLEALPFADGVVDAVWSRDTLECLEDAARAIAEFARVLRIGGGVMLHGSCATERLEPQERARLFAALAIAPDSVDRARIETAIADADFAVVGSERISPEWAENDLERGGEVLVPSMLTIARMTRHEDRFVEALGREWYERILAWAQWIPYLVLGKLEARVWLLHKRAA